MKGTRILAVAFILVASFSSCNKEKRFENRLVNLRDWQITHLSWVKVTQEVNDPDDELAAYVGVETVGTSKAGSFVFREGGTGDFSYEVENDVTREGSFQWLVSDDQISIVETTLDPIASFANLFSGLLGTNTDEFSYTYETFAFSGERSGRNKVQLDGGGVVQIISNLSDTNIGQEVYTLSITLEK